MSLKNILLRTINQKNKFISLAATATKVSNQEQYGHGGQKKNYRYDKKTVATALFSSVVVGTVLAERSNKDGSKRNKDNGDTTIEAGEKRPDLPTFRAEEVSKHDNEKSFWVTYKNGVYDVTSFLPSHPGGDQIMNAAGLSIEPFWNVYGMHKTQEVYALLESYRIGNLHEDDVVDHSDEELWVKEPSRDKRLIVKTAKPFNAETPAKLQVAYFDTPNELFYVRQHMPVPELDASQHRLKVTIKNGSVRSKEFSLQQLHMFPRASVRAALMCAGNRRSEMNEQVKPVKGISWQGGAISSALWEGVLLRDVLVYCGVDTQNTVGKHVIFTGSDIDATGVNFSTSIPLEQALNPNSRIVLATHMNGRPLPPDHGRPLRVVVPGAPAVRSVKWLESITVSTDESSSHWHQKDYRSFNASKTWETADFASAPPIYSLPVTSAICDPADGETVPVRNGSVEIRGYAYSGGGAKILRVDISPDCGKTWVQAEEMQCDDAPPQQHYGWTLWTARIPVQKEQKEVGCNVCGCSKTWVQAEEMQCDDAPPQQHYGWTLWTARIPVQKEQKEVGCNVCGCSKTWVQAEEMQCDDAPPQQHYGWTLWTARIPVQKEQKEVGCNVCGCSKTWVQAEEMQCDDAPPQQHYGWTLWTARIPVQKEQKEVGCNVCGCSKTWVQAEEMQCDDAPPQQHYGWTLWTARIPVQKGQKELELWAKATDSNFNTQPEKFENIWNIRGLLSNAYHKINIQIKH